MNFFDGLIKNDNAFKQKALNKGRVSQAEIQQFEAKRNLGFEQNKDHIKGLFCYIEAGSHALIIQDTATQKTMGSFALSMEAEGTPKETWGSDYALTSPKNGKFQNTLKEHALPQGLLITPNHTLLYPFHTTDPTLLSADHYLAPEIASQHNEVYDLKVSPCKDYLFVVHRWAGSLSVFSLFNFECLGQVQIRARGLNSSLNLAFDAQNQWAYITDNQSQNLYFLEYPGLDLKVFKTSLGILGAIAFDTKKNALFYTRIRPKFSLGYLDLHTLEHIKEINIKGKSFAQECHIPTDLMSISQDGRWLFFVTSLDQPEPKTPIVQVIDLHKAKTVCRYRLEETKRPLGIGTGLPNPFYESSITVLASTPKSVSSQQKTKESTVPELTLPSEAEDCLLYLFQKRLEKEFAVQLSHSPFVIRQLRVKAWETRQVLEQELEAPVTLSFQKKELNFILNRGPFLQIFAQTKQAPKPLFMPIDRCPLCASPWSKVHCAACGFDLLRKKEAPQDKLSPIPIHKISGPQVKSMAHNLMSQISFLEGASEEVKAKLAPCFTAFPFKKEDLLIEEGQLGSCLYFIVQGQLSVSRKSQPIANLTEGDVVGEMALILSEPRVATVKANSEGMALKLARRDFRTVIQAYPKLAKELKVLVQLRKQMLHQYKQNKQEYIMERIKARMAVEKLKEIDIFEKAPEAFFQLLSTLVKAHAFMPKKVLFKQGQAGQSMYFISKGAVEVDLNQGEWSKILHEGDIFGEMSLLLKAPRNATVTTLKYTKIFELQASELSMVFQRFPEIKSRFDNLIESRQKELDQSQLSQEIERSKMPSKAFISAPGFEINGVQDRLINESLFMISALENTAFEVTSKGKIEWHFYEQSQMRLFQPYRIHAQRKALYLVDSGNDRILKLDAQSKELLHIYGDPNIKLSYPRSIDAQSDDVLLIADEGNQRLLVINQAGENLWEYGPNEAVLNPYYAKFTPEGSILYVDSELHLVREIDHQGNTLWQFGGEEQAQDEQALLHPAFAQRLSNGTTLIADKGNHRLIWVSQNGQVTNQYLGTEEAPLIEPMHFSFGESDQLYIFSESAENIVCVSSDLSLLWQGFVLPS